MKVKLIKYRYAIVLFFTLVSVIIVPASYSKTPLESFINVHPLHLDEGADSDNSFSTLRDQDGFLWIATDNGLKRYDGYNLRTFVNDTNDPNSIGSNTITSLLQQTTGEIWVAGNNLNLYHQETETFNRFPVTNGLTIRTLYIDKNGILWIAGDGFGLLGFNIPTKEVAYTFFTKNETRFITSITPKKSTSLIWVTTNSGLFSFDTDNHKITPFPLPLDFDSSNKVIRALIEDRNGNLWLTTQQGLVILNPKTNQFKQYSANPNTPGALKSNTLRSIFEDSKGQIWIGTDKDGVYKYQAKSDSFLHFPASTNSTNRFPPTAIYHIQEDNRGNIWFSAGASGVYRITEELEKFFAIQQGGGLNKVENRLSYNDTLDLLEDKAGNIWIATDGGGLNQYNPNTQSFKHYNHDPNDATSLSGDDVVSLAEDNDGFIWVGTWNAGLNQLNPKTGKFRRITRDEKAKNQQTLTNNNIFRITVTKDGDLLLSTWGKGFQLYNPKENTFESFIPNTANDKHSPSNFSVRDFQETPDGNYWLGGHSGLEVLDMKSKTFTQVELPYAEEVYDLHWDKGGSLWIATSRALIRYHPQTKIAKYFTTKDGLVDNFVVSIEEDERGDLWLGTRRGLSRLSPTLEEFTSFTQKDGLAGSQFNSFSHLKSKNGLMYFGGRQGISVFRPDHLPSNEAAPTIQLISFELFQKPVLPGSSSWLSKHVNFTDKIELPYNQKDILFEFSALNFISPTRNLYKYRLKGLEENWIDASSSQRRVRYTNLSPGSYTFQVLGSNNEGVWNGTAKEVKLTIRPAWWQTALAKAIYGLVILGIIYSFSFWRLRITNRHQRELESIVKQRTLELKEANKAVNQLNSELEQRVVHRTKELYVEIEERRNAEERSSHLAFHDSLTGLPNRAWLLKHLEELIEQRKQNASPFAVLFVGGDRFKQINDTHGHLLGDLLLVAAAKRLCDILPNHFHCVRLGSDEFTVVIDSIETENDVVHIAETILENFKKPFVFEQANMNFNVSIGMLVCNNEYSQPAQILRNVDIAMNHAKNCGRGVFQMFDSKILEHTLQHVSLQTDLQQALRKNQFEVVFQPIIVIQSNQLNSFETLIRWNHPTRGMVPPDQFIPIAEELGIIFDIGLWVLEQACKQLKLWHTLVGDDACPSIAVNLSALQLRQSDLLSKFDAIFAKIEPLKSKIKLEITESALMENTATADQLLESFRQRGIELAIDDFGTGYSSLSYLDKLPVQVLKIDRSFINALFADESRTESAHEIVRATIALAHNLKMRVVAEGIETSDQMEVLKMYKCDFGQGYLISRPLSPAKATEYLLSTQ